MIKSNNFLKKRVEESRRCRVYSEVLVRSSGGGGRAALVDVQPSMTSHHFIPCYMGDLLSPVLGDSFFSYRARPIMGVMMKIGHEMSPHTMQQVTFVTHIHLCRSNIDAHFALLSDTSRLDAVKA